LVLRDARGIVHITNEGSVSWFDFAREILAQSGRDSIPVLPFSTDQAADRFPPTELFRTVSGELARIRNSHSSLAGSIAVLS